MWGLMFIRKFVQLKYLTHNKKGRELNPAFLVNVSLESQKLHYFYE